MEQLHESGASIHRRRRRRRAAITLTLVALMLLGTFTYAAAYFQGWVGTRSVPKPVASAACQPGGPVKALTPSTVTLNVFNSTNRVGLAASVAKSLRTLGFKVVNVTNDPLGKPISDVGEIRYGPAGTAAAAFARTRLSGAKLVLDNRTDPSVDLVLGTKFTALTVPPKVAPATPGKPTPSPSPSC